MTYHEADFDAGDRVICLGCGKPVDGRGPVDPDTLTGGARVLAAYCSSCATAAAITDGAVRNALHAAAATDPDRQATLSRIVSGVIAARLPRSAPELRDPLRRAAVRDPLRRAAVREIVRQRLAAAPWAHVFDTETPDTAGVAVECRCRVCRSTVAAHELRRHLLARAHAAGLRECGDGLAADEVAVRLDVFAVLLELVELHGGALPDLLAEVHVDGLRDFVAARLRPGDDLPVLELRGPVVDYGPSDKPTGRVLELSPGLAAALGAEPGDPLPPGCSVQLVPPSDDDGGC